MSKSCARNYLFTFNNHVGSMQAASSALGSCSDMSGQPELSDPTSWPLADVVVPVATPAIEPDAHDEDGAPSEEDGAPTEEADAVDGAAAADEVDGGADADDVDINAALATGNKAKAKAKGKAKGKAKSAKGAA